MRIRFAFTIDVTRHRPDEPEQFEHRDNDGTLVIHQDQPRYAGFKPADTEPTDGWDYEPPYWDSKKPQQGRQRR